jgi:hypothetical protein
VLGNLTQWGAKALGGRFGLVTMIPGAVVFLFVAALVRAKAYTDDRDLDRVLSGYGDKSDVAAVLLAGVLLTGLVLHPFQIWIVQRLEGYWGTTALLSRVSLLLIEHHVRRKESGELLNMVTAPGEAEPGLDLMSIANHARAKRTARRWQRRGAALRERYPPNADRVLPTLLGNALRRTEDTAGQRYNLDSVHAFPRLFPSLSKPLSDALSQQTSIMDGSAALSVAFGLCALASAPLLRSLDGWTPIPVIAALLAAISYRGAVHAARDHGVLVAAAFDLHRFDLAAAMRYRLPTSPAEEFRLFGVITRLFAGESINPDDRSQRYEHPQPPPVAATPQPPPPDPGPEPLGGKADGDGEGGPARAASQPPPAVEPTQTEAAEDASG